MTITSSGHASGSETFRPDDTMSDGVSFDSLLVMVVGRSRINTVVVSKIVERSGLHSVSVAPEGACDVLKGTLPALVILDGGGANADCEPLMPPLHKLRQSIGRPAVILLCTGNFAEVGPSYADVVDAIVSKPILPELLQPVVDKFVSRAST